MLTFVPRERLTRGVSKEEKASHLKHSHFRLDAYTVDMRIPVKEVYKAASKIVGRRIRRVTDILELTQYEHDKLERYLKGKYGTT